MTPEAAKRLEEKRRKNRIAVRKYRAKHIEQGLCSRCSNPTDDGLKVCATCRLVINDRSRKWARNNKEKSQRSTRKCRERYRAEGRCPECGRPRDPDYDNITCMHCKDKRVERRF